MPETFDPSDPRDEHECWWCNFHKDQSWLTEYPASGPFGPVWLCGFCAVSFSAQSVRCGYEQPMAAKDLPAMMNRLRMELREGSDQ